VDRLEAAVSRLAEAQARTEARVGRLEDAVVRLTETQARTEETVARLAERMIQAEERLARLEEAMTRMAERMAQAEERLSRLEAAVVHLTERMVQAEERLTRLEETVARLAERMAQAEERLTRLEEIVARLAETVARLGERVARLETKVGILDGRLLELLWERRAPAILGTAGFRRCRVVPAQELAALLADLEEQGVLPAEDRDRLFRTDLVVRARRGAQEVWLAVEISAVVDAHDVERAARAAAILAALFGTEAVAVAAGQELTPAAREAGAAQGVLLLTDGAPVV
jgi:predicted transcriptional regulator